MVLTGRQSAIVGPDGAGGSTTVFDLPLSITAISKKRHSSETVDSDSARTPTAPPPFCGWPRNSCTLTLLMNSAPKLSTSTTLTSLVALAPLLICSFFVLGTRLIQLPAILREIQ